MDHAGDMPCRDDHLSDHEDKYMGYADNVSGHA